MNTICIVDDDEKLCEILGSQFCKEGYHVEIFTSAKGLLVKLDKNPSDLMKKCSHTRCLFVHP